MGFLTHQTMSEIVGLILRFESVYKGMPKSKDECNQLEPLQVFRKVEAGSAIRSEMLQLLKENYHFETSFRAKEVVTETLNRMSLFTKPVAARIALYGSSYFFLS